MAWSSYAYAVSGWDAPIVNFVNLETIFTLPLLTAPLRIPRGGVVNKAWDGSETSDGWVEIVLEQLGDPYGVSLYADLTTYVTAVFGSWDGEETAEISLKTLAMDGTFIYLNVLAFMPRIGEDFEFHPMKSAYITGLQLRYTYVNEYTP